MLVVKNWNSLFENNRTRELKKLDWVPFPNKFDGDGYTDLMSRKNGHELFAAWVLIVQVASKCGNPAGMCEGPEGRGKLTRDGVKPHDSESLSRITRAPVRIFNDAIPILLEIGWLEQIPHEGAGIPHEGAPRVYARREWKGTEEKGIEHAFFLEPNFQEAWKNWETARKSKAGELQFKRLLKLSGGSMETAIAILEESAGNGHTGIFPLKGKPQNGTPQVLPPSHNRKLS